MTKDRKFDYLLNVEECLDLILYNDDIKTLKRYFTSHGQLYELKITREGEKIILVCKESIILSEDGHTEIEYER